MIGQLRLRNGPAEMNEAYWILMRKDWGKECPYPVETLPQLMAALYLETFSPADPPCSSPNPRGDLPRLCAMRQGGGAIFCVNCRRWHYAQVFA